MGIDTQICIDLNRSIYVGAQIRIDTPMYKYQNRFIYVRAQIRIDIPKYINANRFSYEYSYIYIYIKQKRLEVIVFWQIRFYIWRVTNQGLFGLRLPMQCTQDYPLLGPTHTIRIYRVHFAKSGFQDYKTTNSRERTILIRQKLLKK